MHRRDFIAANLGGAVSMAAIHSRAFAAAAETRPRVALIGAGWYGKTDLFHLLQVAPVEVVGIADVDRRMRDEAARLVAARQESKQPPPTFGKHQEMLAQLEPEIVLVGSPDHWHCLHAIDAMRAGADVYVQKPISCDVVEGQAMVAAAKKYQRTVQVGLQRRSTPHLIDARERFIDGGAMGRIGYVDVHSYYGSPGPFPPDADPPEFLDWETYVGPAPWRNYNPGIHPKRWRAFREFGNGQTGDLCVHFFDLVRYFLKLGWPTTISATGGSIMGPQDPRINTHDTQTAIFDYPDVQVVWTQRNWGPNPDPQYPWGATLYGEKGTLKLSVRSYDFIPRGGGEVVHEEFIDQRDDYPEDLEHKQTELFAAPATRRHMLNFLAARRDRTKPTADIAEGHISSACCILANLSMDLDRSLKWDDAQGRVAGDDEANALLARPYRGDWQRPTL